MDPTFLEPTSSNEQHAHLHRRLNDEQPARLILQEIDAGTVIDHTDADSQTCEIITFGSVRETCPKCQDSHLKLVLRQQNVRLAHLFCPTCASCFDAHYADGAAALTI